MYFIILLLTIMIPHSVINGMKIYSITAEGQDNIQVDSYIKERILSTIKSAKSDSRESFINKIKLFASDNVENQKAFMAFFFNNGMISEQISLPNKPSHLWRTDLFAFFPCINNDINDTLFLCEGRSYSQNTLIRILMGIGIIYNNINKRFSLLEEEKKEIFRQYVKRNMKENKTIESIKAIIDEECTSYCTK